MGIGNKLKKSAKNYKTRAKNEVLELAKSEGLSGRYYAHAAKKLCESFNRAMNLSLTDNQKKPISDAMIKAACTVASEHRKEPRAIESLKLITDTVFNKIPAKNITARSEALLNRTNSNITLSSGRNYATFEIMETLGNTAKRIKKAKELY